MKRQAIILTTIAFTLPGVGIHQASSSSVGAAQKKAATPVFSLRAGTYSSAQSVKISDATAGSTIYYTTNGTTPTTSSTRYRTAITVSQTETIRAIAVAAGYAESAQATATYTVTGSLEVYMWQLPAETGC
jgi:hypothetical protein